jgi:threonine dehydrogenase-like Zn-dependent dehydrogenase
VILIGYPAYIEIDFTPFMAKELHIVASNVFSNETINGEKKRTMQIALDLMESGQANVKDFITHKFSIDDYKKALEVAVNKSDYNTIKAAFFYE